MLTWKLTATDEKRFTGGILQVNRAAYALHGVRSGGKHLQPMLVLWSS